MTNKTTLIRSLASAGILANLIFVAGCASIVPDKVAPYQPQALPVPETFPSAPVVNDSAEIQDILKNWRKVFADDRLQKVTELALANNRDLRSAVLNVDLARTQYDLQRSGLYPNVNGSASASHGESGTINPATGRTVGVTTSYNAGLSIAWEADLFKRIKSLNTAAQEQYFYARENRDAARIALMGAVASTWLGLAADEQQLKLSEQTLKSREQSLAIVQKRFKVGVGDKLTVRQTQILAETARNDVASLKTVIAQDKNALRLLVGADIEPSLLPTGFSEKYVIANLPVGMPSDILLTRPDVVAAEHSLKASDANIVAARAAFFPQVTLTGQAGKASTDLGDLFSGNNIWSFVPSITVPIFNHGANEAKFEAAKITRDIAINSYEKAIQSAFRDVADQLAIRDNIGERYAAQNETYLASTESLKIVRARYNSGIDSLLTLIDSQRTLYGAEQQLIAIRLAKSINMVNLYSALGGGLEEQTNNSAATAPAAQ